MGLQRDHGDEDALAAVFALGDDDRGEQARRNPLDDETRAVAHPELRPHVADENDHRANLELQAVLLQAGWVVLVAQLGAPDARRVIDRAIDAKVLVQGAGHPLEHTLVDLGDVLAFRREHGATRHVPACARKEAMHLCISCTDAYVLCI